MTPHPLSVLFLDHDMDDLDADGILTRLDRTRTLEGAPDRTETGDGWRFRWNREDVEIIICNTQGRLGLRIFENVGSRRIRLHLDLPREDALWARIVEHGHEPMIDAARSAMETPRGGVTSGARSTTAPPAATHAVEALEGVLQQALDVLAALNPDFPPTTTLRIMSPCLGAPGRIVDDRSKHVFGQKLERALLAGAPAAGVLVRDRGYHDIRPLRAEGRVTGASADAMARLRALSRIEGLPQTDLLLKAGREKR